MEKEIKIGDTASITMEVTEETVRKLAEISGDYNPIHLDEDYAKKTIFRKRIAHGLFCMGLVSNVIGNKLPGVGSIFIEESVRYLSPVYIGDVITCEVTVSEIREKGRILLKFICKNEEKTALDGTTLVKIL